jgi:hypothetical protein
LVAKLELFYHQWFRRCGAGAEAAQHEKIEEAVHVVDSIIHSVKFKGQDLANHFSSFK